MRTKLKGSRLQGVRRRGYDAALLGGTQFMRRYSLAMSLDTPAVKTPAYGRGFFSCMSRWRIGKVDPEAQSQGTSHFSYSGKGWVSFTG